MKATILALTLVLTTLNAEAFCNLDIPVVLPSLENGPVVATNFETDTPGESEGMSLVFDYVRDGKGEIKNAQAIAVRIEAYDRYAGPLSEYPSNIKIESEIVPYGTGFVRHSVFAQEAWWHAESSHLVFKDGKIRIISIMSMTQETKDICIKKIEF